ncbi:uncharacterized protein JCM6883_007284 [Sporobolomyces salmoneus]|uniref:uncharacterized protein n=1 Tax=Sporobolomyces salmoneus TaxID=183962 RepID=UPI00317B5EFA
MDFLTQPFSPPRPSPPQSVPPAPTTPKLSDDMSVLTASTSSTSDSARIDSQNAAFEQLRTVPPPPPSGPGQDRTIEVPSTKKGDWKAYGRVEGRVVLWEKGTLKEKKDQSEEARKEQWSVYGTLWYTKRSEVLLVLDQSVPPKEIPRTHDNEEGGHSFGHRLSLSKLRSTSPTNTKNELRRSSTQEDLDSNEDSSPGFFAKVLDAVRPGRKERRTSTTSASSRSRSRPRNEESTTTDQAQPDSTHAVEALARATVQLTFVDPSSSSPSAASPLPLYKGHPVSALLIPSPSHIQSLRFYPQRPISSSASSASPFSFPFSTKSSQQPLSSPPASPTATTSTNESIPIEPPVVEIDVLDPSFSGGGGTNDDEGKQREATIGFSFVELLCATEAEDFHKILEQAMKHSDLEEPWAVGIGEETIHRTVSKSLETGKEKEKEKEREKEGGRRKSFSLMG